MSRALGFTRARVTQIMDLLLLAPDIQEEILFIESVPGAQPISERALRDTVLKTLDWLEQRCRWDRFCREAYAYSGSIRSRFRLHSITIPPPSDRRSGAFDH